MKLGKYESVREFVRRKFSLDSQCLIYDNELCDAFVLSEALHACLKAIKHRYDRRDSVRLSRSVCEYIELHDSRYSHPHLVYCYTCDPVRICVALSPLDRKYHIFSTLPLDLQRSHVGPFYFGDFDLLGDAVSAFDDCVCSYLRRKHGLL
ncbi:hypothetical protein [Capybara microvirus Cap3_SP_320]|nr:hypothetical protein [Capybara microvirus Cap3_SP_320]